MHFLQAALLVFIASTSVATADSEARGIYTREAYPEMLRRTKSPPRLGLPLGPPLSGPARLPPFNGPSTPPCQKLWKGKMVSC